MTCSELFIATEITNVPPIQSRSDSLVCHRTPGESRSQTFIRTPKALWSVGAVMGTVTVVRLGSYLASGLDLGCFEASERQHLRHI